MKANKKKITINIEVLSLDSVPALLMKLINDFEGKVITGNDHHEDGDDIKWITECENVEF